MKKKKEDGMTDLEIIKQEVDFLDKYMADHELDERFEAILTSATRMAAEGGKGMNIREMQENTNKFFGNQGQTLYNGEQPVLNRIADALEKIARELEKQNKLKAATLRATIESDYLDEIMEG